jgi:hypothetical protein
MTCADGIFKDSEGISMWSFQTKRNALHEQLLLAPESNPSEFVRRYLAQKSVAPKTIKKTSLVERSLKLMSHPGATAKSVG